MVSKFSLELFMNHVSDRRNINLEMIFIQLTQAFDSEKNRIPTLSLMD